MSKTKLVVAFIALCINSAFALQGPNAHFDTDKAEVINAKEIKAFAESISGSAELVVIYCHTDSRASVEYNKKLAAQRCAEVGDLLKAYNLDLHAYVVEGEAQLLVKEEGKMTDKHGRMGLNRRVTIMYTLKEKPAEKVETVVVKEVFKRHRVTIAGGYAPSGVKESVQIGPNKFKVREDFDLELGGSYSFRITKRFNIGVAGYTNKSGFLHLGLDF